MTPRARGYLFFGITLVLAVVFVRLGVWQLSRLQDRRAFNREVLAARSLPALNLDSAGVGLGAEPANRRVVVTGRYDFDSEVVLRGQTERGVAGVRIVTPLRTGRGDSAVLVQRGFVPSPDAATVDLSPLHEEGTVTVRGLATVLPDSGSPGEPRQIEGHLTWRRVELAELRRRARYPITPLLILQTPDSTLPSQPRRDEAPVLDDGPHLSYAIQWFSFAVIALTVGAIIGFRQKDRDSSN